jgi:uncharacterized hydrophobic protein (TIGR00271 family)
VIMNALATVVACYGLLANSVAVVIGAMIIAMLLGPITGIALAIVDGDSSLLRQAMQAEVAGAGIVLAVSWCIGRVHSDMPLTSEMLARTQPNIMDLMIALAGGAAGAYATVSPRVAVGLVGVAIATALVPPLAVCGICLAHGYMALARGSFLLFFANFVAIQVSSSLVMWLHGFHRLTVRSATPQAYRARIAVSLALLLVLGVLLESSFAKSVAQRKYEASVEAALNRGLGAYPGVRLTSVRFTSKRSKVVITAVARTPYSFSPARVAALEGQLPTRKGQPVELHVRSVITKETTRRGYLHELGPSTEPPGSEAPQTAVPIEGL